MLSMFAGGGEMTRSFFKNTIIFFLALLTGLLFSGNGQAFGFTSGDYEYEHFTISGDTGTYAKLTAYTGKDAYVNVPGTIDGLKVKALENTFAWNETIVGVAIPDGVISLNHTFDHCDKLKNVALPSSVENYESTFVSSGLTEITLPAGEYELENTFQQCAGLKKINIQGTATSAHRTFYGCTALEDVTIKDIAAHNNMYETFYSCKSLKTLRLTGKPEMLNATLANCTELTTVYLPVSVQYMENTFYNCKKLKDVHYGGTDCQWQELMDNSYLDSSDRLRQATVHFSKTGAHNFGPWTVTKAASQTAEGSETRECRKCRLGETRSIAKLPAPPKETEAPPKETEKKTETKPAASTSKTFSVKLKKTSYLYTGKAIKAPLKGVYVNGKAIAPKYYTVTYKKNKNVGVATVVVTGKGTYKAFKGQTTFKIKMRKATLKSLKSSKKGQLTITWNKDKQAYGYVIQYSQDSAFKNGVTTVKITSGKTVKKTVKKLASNKTYYVRVRAFRKVNGSLWYGGWGAKKSVKIK